MSHMFLMVLASVLALITAPGISLTRDKVIRDKKTHLQSLADDAAQLVKQGRKGWHSEPVQVTTKRGKTFNGVVRRENADEIVLALDATNEARIARDEIDEMAPGKVSIMPAGLDKQLTARELADLIAFLESLTESPATRFAPPKLPLAPCRR